MSATSFLAGVALSALTLWASPPTLLQAAHHPHHAPCPLQPLPAAAPPPPTCPPALLARLSHEHPLALAPYARALPGNLSRAGVAGGPSSLASPACPMYVLPAQLPASAPPSARLLAWAMAAAVAHNFGATLVRRPLAAPWEAQLGLQQAQEGEVAWEALQAAGGAPLLQLPGWAGVRYDEDALRRGPWWDAFNDPRSCGAALELPVQGRSWDVLWLSKGAAAHRYAAERAARRGREPALQWQLQQLVQPGDVHIAVHARRVHIDMGSSLPPEEHEQWDAHHAAWSQLPPQPAPNLTAPATWLYYPTKEAVLARVVRDTVLPAFAAAQGAAAAAAAAAAPQSPPLRLRLHLHVFSKLLPTEQPSAVFPALAALPMHSLHFYGGEAADEWSTFHHLARADVLVGSASQWSLWAAHFSSTPLVLSQPDADKWRQCGEGEACCLASGECPYPAQALALAAATRLLAREQCRQAAAAARGMA